MVEDRVKLSQGWFMYYLGQVMGQESHLFDKASKVVNEIEEDKEGKVNALPAIEELVELTKKFQNNAAMLMARCEVWRLEWKQQHGQVQEAPIKEKP